MVFVRCCSLFVVVGCWLAVVRRLVSALCGVRCLLCDSLLLFLVVVVRCLVFVACFDAGYSSCVVRCWSGVEVGSFFVVAFVCECLLMFVVCCVLVTV